MNPNTRKVLKTAEYGAMTVLIVLAAYVTVSYAFGVQTIYVVSDNPSSMSPTMTFGDLALTYRVPFANLQAGDIVTFHDPRGNPGVIVHRIVSQGMCGGQLCFQTKGDNNVTNPTPDPWNLTAAYYLSKVVLVVPAIGYVSPALWGFQGLSVAFPLSFVALVVLFAAYGMKANRTGTEEKKGKKSD